MRTLWAFVSNFGFAFVVMPLALSVLWLAPPVFWLTVVHGWALGDAFRAASSLAAGSGPSYPTVTPGFIGLALFDIAAWAVVVSPFALGLLAWGAVQDRRLMASVDRDLAARG